MMAEFRSAEHDSDTNKGTIYSLHGGAVLWTGTASFAKFQALQEDFRRAERLAYQAGVQEVADKLRADVDRLIAQSQRGESR